MSQECRLSRFGSYPVREFNRISCSYCYSLLVYVFSDIKFGFNVTQTGHFMANNVNHLLDPLNKNDSLVIKDSMRSNEYDKWRTCCFEAEKCCLQVMSKYSVTTLSNLSCNSIWDGWSCHSVTPAGSVSQVDCPSHFIEDTCNSVIGIFLNK